VAARLDDDEMSAWQGLRATFGDVQAGLDADLVARHGLTEGEFTVLVELAEAPEHELRMCDLAAHLHLSPSGLTRRLDRLVRAGYVARQPSSDDRRVTLAVLTRRGQTKLAAVTPDHVASVRRHLLDHLTRAQVRQLAATFAALRRRPPDLS
jgi:DNA-binding MarR family transcriptional regulator